GHYRQDAQKLCLVPGRSPGRSRGTVLHPRPQAHRNRCYAVAGCRQGRIRQLHDEWSDDPAYAHQSGRPDRRSHMRNRALNAYWVYEKGKADHVVSFEKIDGKTYVQVNDYEKLRTLFGELLREIQRIKSEGDYEAGKNLVETYGVKV